jgi:hypothetical protein
MKTFLYNLYLFLASNINHVIAILIGIVILAVYVLYRST